MPFDSTTEANIKLTVGKIPGHLSETKAPKGTSVRDILVHSGIETSEAEGYSLTVNNRSAGLDDPIDNDATVLLTRKIEGN